MLSLKNVQVLYDRAIEAVRDVSLEVPGGAIVALLGSNGAGKSTILKAISGVLAQEDGEIVNGSVHLEGSQISGRSPREIVRAGLLQVPMPTGRNSRGSRSAACRSVEMARQWHTLLSRFPSSRLNASSISPTRISGSW